MPISYQYRSAGYWIKKIRGYACTHIFLSSGVNINVEHGAYFGSGELLEIGDNSSLGVNCQVPNNVKIGNDVMIGPDVLIVGTKHGFSDLEIPMRLQKDPPCDPVEIGNDVWIGARVVILPGIKVGNGAIIGAGTVVTKDVPPFAIFVGNPGYVKKYRTDKKS